MTETAKTPTKTANMPREAASQSLSNRAVSAHRIDTTSMPSCRNAPTTTGIRLNAAHTMPTIASARPTHTACNMMRLVRRAMEMGFYEGVNLSLAYCDDCGHQELDMDVCPKCGSRNLTKIDRMNGYLSYSRVKGDTRLNDAKMAEISERKSM